MREFDQKKIDFPEQITLRINAYAANGYDANEPED